MSCIEHVGHRDKRGYGQKKYKGKVQFAHRVALALHLGKEPWDLAHVLHSCDNPACVNPEHLREGDRVQNMTEAAQRLRLVHKVTKEQAVEIKNKFVRTGPRKSNTNALAVEYGVDREVITSIVKGKRKMDQA